MSATETAIEKQKLHVLAPQSLPEGSTLGAIQRRMNKSGEYLREQNARLNSYRSELEEVERRLKTATLLNTTAEEFSLDSARAILLKQTIALLTREDHYHAKRGFEGLEGEFNQRYREYVELVERHNKLLPEPEGRYVDLYPEERAKVDRLNALRQAIDDLVGV